MRKAIKIFLVVLILLVSAIVIWRYATKAHSPEDMSVYSENDLTLEVVYNRPFKKGRKIFGELVPYDEVWRTGANEATTFSTNKDIYVDGSLLEKGIYTLWTIPKPQSWKVIFNSKMYPWGINMEKKAYRDPAYDVLVLEQPTSTLKDTLEQFSIYFEQANELILLNFAWDDTKVTLPITQLDK